MIDDGVDVLSEDVEDIQSHVLAAGEEELDGHSAVEWIREGWVED